MGAAPAARILAMRAFDPSGTSAEGTTFGILKGARMGGGAAARASST